MKRTIQHVLSLTLVLGCGALAWGQSPIRLEHDGAGLAFRWQGESNVMYTIAHTDDLTENEWTQAAFSATGSGTQIAPPVTNVIGGPLPLQAFFKLLSTYHDNEAKDHGDMLTPQFYNSASNSVFRSEVNRFVYYAEAEPFHHPLSDASDSTPAFSVPIWGAFGAGKGPGGTASHHPAVDMRVGSGETNVNLYACIDGHVSTFRDADKYRHYLSISNQVVASNGDVVGAVFVIYGHIDLDLDEADSLFMQGQYVAKGDLVSKHLYAGTVGGPHLHFEIRYYRPGDTIGDEFYGGVQNPDYSEPSSGPWAYGAWASNAGYGFGYPGNHGIALE